MTAKRKSKNNGYLIGVGIVTLLLVGGLIALQPVGDFLSWVIRGAAILGYVAVFLAIISSAYLVELVRFFGRPFVKVHHLVSISGLVLITLHPLGAALRSNNLNVFLPKFDSWQVFLQLGGRPAWYLIGIAALAALFRTALRRRWRWVHVLNYVAFLLATVHAIWIGTDFQNIVMRVLAIGMALASGVVFVHKRRQLSKRRSR